MSYDFVNREWRRTVAGLRAELDAANAELTALRRVAEAARGALAADQAVMDADCTWSVEMAECDLRDNRAALKSSQEALAAACEARGVAFAALRAALTALHSKEGA